MCFARDRHAQLASRRTARSDASRTVSPAPRRRVDVRRARPSESARRGSVSLRGLRPRAHKSLEQSRGSVERGRRASPSISGCRVAIGEAIVASPPRRSQGEGFVCVPLRHRAGQHAPIWKHDAFEGGRLDRRGDGDPETGARRHALERACLGSVCFTPPRSPATPTASRLPTSATPRRRMVSAYGAVTGISRPTRLTHAVPGIRELSTHSRQRRSGVPPSGSVCGRVRLTGSRRLI